MAAVAPQQSGDGDWKNELQLPAKDMRYKTEVSMRQRGMDRHSYLLLSPTVWSFVSIYLISLEAAIAPKSWETGSDL